MNRFSILRLLIKLLSSPFYFKNSLKGRESDLNVYRVVIIQRCSKIVFQIFVERGVCQLTWLKKKTNYSFCILIIYYESQQTSSFLWKAQCFGFNVKLPYSMSSDNGTIGTETFFWWQFDLIESLSDALYVHWMWWCDNIQCCDQLTACLIDELHVKKMSWQMNRQHINIVSTIVQNTRLLQVRLFHSTATMNTISVTRLIDTIFLNWLIVLEKSAVSCICFSFFNREVCNIKYIRN